ncbi:MAG: arginine deiminase-related protein [Bacteroidetes bacterium]|jgi:hypothetical protein|nr:arginine deiminase-related protein [Bacteroidota bacterium]MDF1867081.1 arginine deiminase-related protein [Saprospiraceae bacterium]
MTTTEFKQTTSNLFMVRPANFGYNLETAENNSFQVNDQSLSVNKIKDLAKIEFDNFVKKLTSNGINVIIGHEPDEPIKTDSVFPNNWVSFHENGTIITYPMFAPTRRIERSEGFLTQIAEQFEVQKRIRFEQYEAENLFLEGTGSMIFDRENRIVYACLSPRTNKQLLDEFCEWADYESAVFHAVDSNDEDIYHTNVMMAVGETFVVICLESIKDKQDLINLKALFAKTKKEIIDISMSQVEAFAGNMLQVRNKDNKTFLVMSEQAFDSLTQSQIGQIENHTTILYSAIPTIEKYGGGSARCMMAEVFLKEKDIEKIH